MPSFHIFLLLLFICSVFCHATAKYEYDSFITKQQSISDNKTILTIDNSSLLVCPINATPVIQQSNTDSTPKKTREAIRLSTSDLNPLIAAFKSSTKHIMANISEYTQQILHAAKNKVHQFEYELFYRQAKDELFRAGTNIVQSHLRPLGYSIRRTIVPLVYSVTDKKDDLIQWLGDISTHPELEWYIFTTRFMDHWTYLSRRLGIDAFIRHIHRQLSSSSTFGPEPPFSHLDDLFKTMLETDHHSKFYQQQMAQYYQDLSPMEQERVRYSQRDFTQWAQDSALKTHEFVLQTQQDWIGLMQSLYYDMETRLECLSRPPPTTMTMATKKCLPNHRRQAWLLLAPAKDQSDDASSSSSFSNRQRYEWMFQLEKIHRELKTTMDCICPFNNNDDDNDASSSSSSPRFQQQRIGGSNDNSHHNDNNNSDDDKGSDDDLESIEMLSNLKKNMIRRFARLDKDLYRTFYSTTPPNGHQPIHTIYNRLRENVSAKNKSTYETYLTRLIHSWTTMMATTLDTANSVADDLSWLSSSHQHHTPGSMALIWASAQRKLDRNNAHLIHQWETLFTDLDQTLQGAWMDMLAMVDQSHQSSLERVRTFWHLNKARLSTFFSSLFSPSAVLDHP